MLKNQNRVSLKDKMVLTGIVLGILYWIVETLYFAFASDGSSFLDILFGAGVAGVGIKIIAICFFIILGAHAQYNLNKRKKMENEIATLTSELRDLKKGK
ncbi:MAG: hypothetical protein BBJ57_13445 [Desulfobacterales bacterium PC51MH44]|nr:MAG: hypothetical protein BBJ57_13445 [Desulfobacterales bacterium PC51MH44]